MRAANSVIARRGRDSIASWKPAVVVGMGLPPMATKKTARKTPEPTLRHLWLAGFGLIAVVRREAIAAAAEVPGRLKAARARAEAVAGQAQRDVLGRLADARTGRFSAEVETRLEPVLVKLGLKKPARKPSARTRNKPATKRTRVAPARKPAGTRTRTRRA